MINPPGLHAIMVSVDFSDILALTLPYNRHHFEKVTLITSSADYRSVQDIADVCDARVLVTDLFYANGAMFNKWAALEWALDQIGREGWLVFLDADILWPKEVPSMREYVYIPGNLYVPHRRIMLTGWNASNVYDESAWERNHVDPVNEHAGYSQIFHCSDPHLGAPPWHRMDYIHAGVADSIFQLKWNPMNKKRPPFLVLHIGPSGVNWCGRAMPYLNGDPPIEAAERLAKLRDMLSRRSSLAGSIDERCAHERIKK
jgi:hypothetical protein